MLSIQQESSKATTSTSTSTIHILPCRIQHTGPAKVTKRYWSPTTESDGSKTAFFRGRKLKGRALDLPDTYTGVVAKSTDREFSRKAQTVEQQDSDVEEEQKPEPVQPLDTVAGFQDITVWRHDHAPSSNDPFVKGLDEWIAFAQSIHGARATEDTIEKPNAS